MNTHLIESRSTHIPCLARLRNVRILHFVFHLEYFSHLDIVNGKKKISNAAIGKEFKREYNLLSYKLVFQLAFKEENMIFISHTNCETENIDESMFESIISQIEYIESFSGKPSPSPSKRSASSLSEPIFEEDNTSDSLCTSPTKKFKPTMTGLPVRIIE